MSAFLYETILLHTQPKNWGWIIYGIRPNNHTREELVKISHLVGEHLAQRWADQIAKNLAGKPAAEVD